MILRNILHIVVFGAGLTSAIFLAASIQSCVPLENRDSDTASVVAEELPGEADETAVTEDADQESEEQAAGPEEALFPPLNLNSPEQNARSFLLTRGSTDPNDEVIYYWKGEMFLVEKPDPNLPPQNDYRSPVLYFEGFNIGRFETVPGGTRMLTREITVYKNSYGQIIDCWNSPWTGEALRVMHVANNPVNFTIDTADYDLLGDRVVFKLNVSLDYPSPLPMDAYPAYSTGNTYQSTELFNFYVSEMDLRDPNAVSVPVEISWSRVGQPLPWMQRDPDEGTMLIYHSRGRKLLEGFEGLPTELKEFVRDRFPQFEHPPVFDQSPNETSWKRFKKLLDQGVYESTCQ
jgi:hypothetical protein